MTENLISYYTRTHEMKSTTEGSYCLHCNSRTGIGFYVFVQCNLRFNEEGFKQYLDFRNISAIGYVKRFTNEVYTRSSLMKDFKRLTNNALTQQIINQKPYLTENAL